MQSRLYFIPQKKTFRNVSRNPFMYWTKCNPFSDGEEFAGADRRIELAMATGRDYTPELLVLIDEP